MLNNSLQLGMFDDNGNVRSEPIPEELYFDPDLIRRIEIGGVEYFSLVDLMAQFSSTTNEARKYWNDTKKRLKQDGFQLSDGIRQLRLPSTDGKSYKTDCADGETCLRILQSVPSPKTEPVRQWFAQLGYERIEETINPELGVQRAIGRAANQYSANGKSQNWTETRLTGKMSRAFFTDSLFALLRNRANFALATENVYRGTFGYGTKALQQRVGITNPKKQELRDSLSVPALNALSTAEYLCGMKLAQYAENDILPDSLVYQTILDVSRAVGLEGKETERLMTEMGIDYLTGQPLLGSGQ
jgi:hypothetical protein